MYVCMYVYIANRQYRILINIDTFDQILTTNDRSTAFQKAHVENKSACGKPETP